ncbi:MAG: universal stress protein [Bacteroidia bacterium]|nr:universal stress protein [Bacteroidia bacterium]
MKTILVPTDFSAGAANAMSFAVKLALKTKCKVIFFHSCYFDESGVKSGLTYEDSLRLSKEYSAKKLIAEAEKTFKSLKISAASVKHEFVVDFSPSASDSIINTCKIKKPDLVVTGTHGASGIKKFLFGSNTSHLISAATVPVLALPLHYKDADLETILYCADLNNSMEELKKIKKFNEKLGAKIEVVNIDYGWALSVKERTTLHKLEKENLLFRRVKVPMEFSLQESLNKEMKSKKHAVLCMFHEKKTGIAGFLFGGKTQGISMALKFPLLSFPK